MIVLYSRHVSNRLQPEQSLKSLECNQLHSASMNSRTYTEVYFPASQFRLKLFRARTIKKNYSKSQDDDFYFSISKSETSLNFTICGLNLPHLSQVPLLIVTPIFYNAGRAQFEVCTFASTHALPYLLLKFVQSKSKNFQQKLQNLKVDLRLEINLQSSPKKSILSLLTERLQDAPCSLTNKSFTYFNPESFPIFMVSVERSPYLARTIISLKPKPMVHPVRVTERFNDLPLKNLFQIAIVSFIEDSSTTFHDISTSLSEMHKYIQLYESNQREESGYPIELSENISELKFIMDHKICKSSQKVGSVLQEIKRFLCTRHDRLRRLSEIKFSGYTNANVLNSLLGFHQQTCLVPLLRVYRRNEHSRKARYLQKTKLKQWSSLNQAEKILNKKKLLFLSSALQVEQVKLNLKSFVQFCFQPIKLSSEVAGLNHSIFESISGNLQQNLGGIVDSSTKYPAFTYNTPERDGVVSPSKESDYLEKTSKQIAQITPKRALEVFKASLQLDSVVDSYFQVNHRKPETKKPTFKIPNKNLLPSESKSFMELSETSHLVNHWEKRPSFNFGGLKLIVSEDVVENLPDIISRLSACYGIISIDSALQRPTSFIVNSTTAVCLFERSEAFGSLKLFVKELASITMKFEVIWIITHQIKLLNEVSSNHVKDTRESIMLALYQAMLKFPVKVVVREAFSHIDCVNIIAHCCHETLVRDSFPKGTQIMNREFLKILRNDENQCQIRFLAILPMFNEFNACEILSTTPLRDLVQLSVASIITKLPTIKALKLTQFSQMLDTRIGIHSDIRQLKELATRIQESPMQNFT
jgi:hypothetical protein